MQTFDKVKCQVYSYFADLFLASCSSSNLFLFHNDQAMTQHCPNAVRRLATAATLSPQSCGFITQ